MEETLHILDIGANGDGVARLGGGETVFVSFTLPGDVVRAKVQAEADGVLRAQIVSFDAKGEARQTPPCRHFEICGGCALQHVEDGFYQSYKKNNVLLALERAGVPRPEMVGSVFIPPATRRRANFAARRMGKSIVLGFHERRSGTIRDIPDCLVVKPAVQSMANAIRPILYDIIPDNEKYDVMIQMVEGSFEIGLTGKLPRHDRQEALAFQEALGAIMRLPGVVRVGRRDKDFQDFSVLLEAAPLLKTFGALTVNLAPGAFLQPSDEGEKALSDLVVEAVGQARKVADLFCGNGTFTGRICEGREVYAADFAPAAIKALRTAAAGRPVTVEDRNLFKQPLLEDSLNRFDAVILDPPRAGALAQVEALAGARVPRIVYVSCSPVTFARDAAVLKEGGYEMAALTVVDQFIWSPHTEIVAVFER